MALAMFLEEGTGGSRFLPIVKFDAKLGEFIAVNSEPQSDGTWDKTEEEIKLPIKAVADFDNLRCGWVTYKPKYHAVFCRADEKMPPKPSPEHKQAVSLQLFFKDIGLREFTPGSKTVMRVIDKLHTDYMAERDENPGKMPVVEFQGTETVKVKTPEGELKFKAPTCKIIGWTAPPEAFVKAAAPAPVKSASKSAPMGDDEF